MLIVKDKSPSSLTLSSLCMLETQQSKATPNATELETGGRGAGKGGPSAHPLEAGSHFHPAGQVKQNAGDIFSPVLTNPATWSQSWF